MRSGILTAISLALLLGYTSWVRGGSPHGWQDPIPYLAGLAWVAMFIAPFLRKKSKTTEHGVSPSGLREATRIFRDPLFYIALLFLCLLGLQWWNAGRFMYYDQYLKGWRWSNPFHPVFPSAFSKKEAAEMLIWFFPAFTIALCIRNGIRSRRSLRLLLNLSVLSGALLGIFGIVQFLAGTRKVFWQFPMNSHFFASFSYQNHAGEYFFLLFCLALGLFFRLSFLQEGGRMRTWGQWGLLLVCVIALLSVHMASVAASLLLIWLVLAVSAVFAVAVGIRHMHPAIKVKMIFGMMCFASLAFVLVTGTARKQVAEQIKEITDGKQIAEDVDVRCWQLVTATRIWKNDPWFGVGGWGYRHMVGFHVPRKAWKALLVEGTANVHNDTMQFLAEFGAVGLGLLVFAVFIIAAPIFRLPLWDNGLVFFASFGVLMLYIHSMVDLPFRNPAILFMWVTMLASAGQYCRLTEATRSKVR